MAISYLILAILPLQPQAIQDRKPLPRQDQRIIDLKTPEIRNNPLLLDPILESLWNSIPSKDVAKEKQFASLLSQAVKSITVHSSTHHITDTRVIIKGNGKNTPILSLFVAVGLPMVPTLLSELESDDGTVEGKLHREICAECIYLIYDKGGEGGRTARERIKAHAERFQGEKKERILKIINDVGWLKP